MDLLAIQWCSVIKMYSVLKYIFHQTCSAKTIHDLAVVCRPDML